MKRYGNLFDKIVDWNNLRWAAGQAMRGKTWQRAVRKFEANYEKSLSAIQKSLVEQTFTTSEYTEKVVFEPKKRTIYKLPFEPDRIVQHALLQIVAPIWDAMFIEDSYACRPGRGMHQASTKAMDYVRKYKYCFKADISKFYPSIDHEILRGLVRRKIKCKKTLWLLDDIIDSFPGGKNAPIGNYTSQWFGNLYMNELDQWVKHEKKVSAYIRYCDDFIIFSDSKTELHQLRKEIEVFLRDRLKLKFSKSSVFPVTQGVDFLGYRHFPGYKLLRKSTARRVKRRLLKLEKLLKKGRISLRQFDGSIASTSGWLRWANTENFRISVKLRELEQLSKQLKQAEKEKNERLSEIRKYDAGPTPSCF